VWDQITEETSAFLRNAFEVRAILAMASTCIAQVLRSCLSQSFFEVPSQMDLKTRPNWMAGVWVGTIFAMVLFSRALRVTIETSSWVPKSQPNAAI